MAFIDSFVINNVNVCFTQNREEVHISGDHSTIGYKPIQSIQRKETKYTNILSKMQQLYEEYKFNIVVVGIGAMGAMPKPLEKNVRKLFPQKEDIDTLFQGLQKAVILGTALELSNFIVVFTISKLVGDTYPG